MSDMRVSLRVGAVMEQSYDRTIRASIGKARGIRERLGKALGTAFRVKVGATQDASVGRVVGDTRAELGGVTGRTARVGATQDASVGRVVGDTKAELGGVTGRTARVGATQDASVGRVVGDTRAELGGVTGRTARVGATQDASVGRVVGDTKAGLSEIDRAAERTQQRLGRIAKAGDALEGARRRLSERRAGLTDAVIGGTAMLAPVVGSISKGIELESVVADINKVVGLTDAEVTKMGASILQLSTRMPIAAAGLGEIMVAAAQAGTAKEDLREFAVNAGMLAVAFDISGRDAGERMTALRDIFKLDMGGVMGAAGAFNHLSNNMAATAPALLDVTQRAAPMARSFGLTAEQTGALGATMLALKTPPEVAGTAISAMLARLSTAPQQTGKFQDALDELGISADEFDDRMRHDAQGALLEFFETLAAHDNKKGIAFEMFGLENTDDVLRIVDNMDMYRAALGYATDKAAAAGSVQKEYDERLKTTGSAMQLLRNQFSAMGAHVGTALLEPLKDVAGALGSVVEVGATMAEKFPGATRAVVGTTTAVVGLAVATAAGGYAASLLQVGFAKARLAALRFIPGAAMADAALGRFTLRGVGSAIRGLGALRLAMIGTGVGALVVALGVGAAMVVKYWEPIKAFFGGFAAGVGAAMAPIGEAFKPLAPAFQWVGDVIGWIGDALGKLFAPIELTREELAGFGETGRYVGELVGRVFRVALTPVTGLVGMVGKALSFLGLLDESKVEATIKAAQEAATDPAVPTQTPPPRVGRNLVGATMTAAALSGAPALAAPPAFPTIGPAAPAVTAPVAFPAIGPADPATVGAEAARIRAEVGAVFEASPELERDRVRAETEAEVAALEARHDGSRAGDWAGYADELERARRDLREAQAGAPVPGPEGEGSLAAAVRTLNERLSKGEAAAVTHVTYNVHVEATDDAALEDKIERILERLIRRQQSEEGLSAEDPIFL